MAKTRSSLTLSPLSLVAPLLLVCLAACADGNAAHALTDVQAAASTASTPDAGGAPDAGTAPAMPGNLHWVRNSAEYQASVRQSYRIATRIVSEPFEGRRREEDEDPWGVVLDADETILDNSQFQKESWQQHVSYTPERWTAWVQRREAKAVPGAIAFLQTVRGLGGRIAIVTNRTQAECPDTERNLASVGVPYDLILCKSDTSDKNPRFRSIADGTAKSTIPAFDIWLFVGDNIKDFPNLDQRSRTEETLGGFGLSQVLLPNPMYGSWEGNPQD